MEVVVNEKSALIIVDVQRDFCPGGSLPVPKGNEVVPMLNKYVKRFVKAKAPVYATRDWHPPNHLSFKPHGGPWPLHCIQNTKGAEFHPDLELPRGVKIVSKALDPDREAYSGFEGTVLAEDLKKRGVRRVFVGGLATDYCVKNTVLDALNLGFEVILLEDAVRGVDVKAGDGEEAVREMVKKGARKASLRQIV